MGDAAPFDEVVVAGVRRGDPDALATVYRVLADPMTAYVRSQLGDEHAAQDVVLETFLELVRSCRQIRGDAYQLRGWLYRAARRNVLDHVRTRARRPEDPAADVPLGGGGVDPADLAVASVEAAHLRAALGALSADQREVLSLRFLADLSAPEVAAVTGRSEGAVRALQHRGVAALARALEAEAAP